MVLSATAQNNIQVIIEDVISGPGGVEMLDFLSEYEFASGKSHMQRDYEILPKNANILDHMTKKCREVYNNKPLICILDED